MDGRFQEDLVAFAQFAHGIPEILGRLIRGDESLDALLADGYEDVPAHPCAWIPADAGTHASRVERFQRGQRSSL